MWTDEIITVTQAAADADIIGADEVLAAIEEEDYGAFEEASEEERM